MNLMKKFLNFIKENVVWILCVSGILGFILQCSEEFLSAKSNVFLFTFIGFIYGASLMSIDKYKK